MAFSNSFTGKGIATVLPSGEGLQRSQERMSDMILNAEKLKYDTFKKNEEEFLKASNIDPVFVLSNSAREVQSKMLEQFNTTWGKVMKERGGNLTTDDKIQMAKEKDFILMNQQKMQSDMERIQLHRKMVAQNPNRWSDEEQSLRENEYMKSGSYEHTEPPIRPLSLTDAAMRNMNKIATKEYIPKEEEISYTIGGVPWKKSTTYSASKADVVPYIKSALADNDQYAVGAIKEWNELTPQEKEKYHTTNPQNPILEMAVDRHWKEWVKSEVKESRNTMGQGGASGNMRTWNGQKYTPTSAMSSPYVGLSSDGYHPITNLTKQMTIPVSRMELLEEDKASAEKPAQSIKGYVTGYDEGTDKIIFLVSQDYKDLDYPTLSSGRGMQIAVPRSDFSKEIFDDLEIVKDGKYVKIKDLTPSTVSKPKGKTLY